MLSSSGNDAHCSVWVTLYKENNDAIYISPDIIKSLSATENSSLIACFDIRLKPVFCTAVVDFNYVLKALSELT